jgi:hypothetical protein
LKIKSPKLWLLAAITIPFLFSAAAAQSSSLASLPDADVIIYASPQRILNDAAPKLMSAKDLADMRSTFAELKKSAGIDPATVEYLVIVARFNKPAADLSFVAPDVMAVFGGDFSSDSLLTLAQLSLQDKVRTEKHGAKTIALMRVDPIAEQAQKYPVIKSLSEIGAVALTPNSVAVGTLSYLKSAIDAVDGNGRINPATLQSLLRDPNALIASTGSPLTAFAKGFGLLGTETNARASACDMHFGNFYSAVTMSGANFSLRGAMNADNPDTAKIITGLLSSLLKAGIENVPDKQAQTVLQNIRLAPRDNEVVVEADVPEQAIMDLLKPTPKQPQATVSSPAPAKAAPRRPVRKKRPRQ